MKECKMKMITVLGSTVSIKHHWDLRKYYTTQWGGNPIKNGQRTFSSVHIYPVLPWKMPWIPRLTSTSLLGPRAFGLPEGAGKPNHLQLHPLKEVPWPHRHTPAPPAAELPRTRGHPPCFWASRVQRARTPGAWRARSEGCVSPVSAPDVRSHHLPSGSSGVSPSRSEVPSHLRHFAHLYPQRARLRKLL